VTAPRVNELARPVLLGLDVDGTLAPIVEDPEAASVTPSIREVLGRLVELEGLTVALITGRDAAALAYVAPLPAATVARVWRGVEHGRVILAPGEDPEGASVTEEEAARLAAFEAEAESLRGEGARLERKPASRAVHVRGLADAIGDPLLERAEAMARRHGLTPRRGRAVLEAEVRVGSKRAALEAIADRTDPRSVVFAGDDVTDFEAIAFAASRGLGAFVRSPERSEGPPEAQLVLDGPAAVDAWLREIADRWER
jgi:trehalose 6-phosphate phosphatase